MTSAVDSPDPETVLVVEDEIFVRMVISDYLRSCGYKAVEAAGADEALAVLQQGGIRIDVVFSDVEMPGSTDGFGLAKWIHANLPGLDVILAATVAGSASAAEKLCEATYLSKPHEAHAVVEKMGWLRALPSSRSELSNAADAQVSSSKLEVGYLMGAHASAVPVGSNWVEPSLVKVGQG
jgi:CheY-like chemotaxis protein